MKKLLKTLFILAILIICLICLINKLGILDVFYINEISTEDLSKYSNYYFNKLSEVEQKTYVRIAKAVEKNENRIYFGDINETDMDRLIEKVLEAFFDDNPKYFYFENKYTVYTKEIWKIKLTGLELTYEYTDNLEDKKEELNSVIDNFLRKTITNNMTDYEKELAIHDELVKTVNYYDFEDINKIPSIKHTAYGALVQNEAVCDGYSKAFKMLLEKAGIQSIVVSGELEDVAHAWNIVEIDGKHYHVDVTSDNIDEKGKKYIIHTYFNLTDENIKKTHKISTEFELPKCDSEEYNYYIFNKFTLEKNDNITNKLKHIIKNSKNNVVEFKNSGKYSSNRIVDELYDLNYNNWKTKRISNITYNTTDDIYIFK